MTDRLRGAHHFFVAAEDVQDGVVVITGDEAHHAARVLRVRPGEAITVADGSGRVIDAVVSETGSTVRAEVRGERVTAVTRPAITLYQAIAKGQRMDDLVEKAVEVGVRRIVPFMAERTIVRWERGKREQVPARWRAIAKAAAKQSRSPYLTEIDAVADGAAEVVKGDGHVIVLDETSSLPLREALPSTPPEVIAIVVGPEGSFTRAELDELRSGGARHVTLGPRIFRTETAGPVAAAIVAYAYGTLG